MPTVGVIAQRLGEPVWRVEYIIHSRHIKPIGWAGNARVFSEADISFIASEIRHVRGEAGGDA